MVVHKVGNKTREEGVELSEFLFGPSKELEPILMSYFLSSFRSNVLYNFYHETGEIDFNRIYALAKAVFSNPTLLKSHSIDIANFLYDQSIHPKIKEGELYVCYFSNVLFDDEECDAIGIFKSEQKEPFLNVVKEQKFLSIKNEYGINATKLDKGCLILNTEKDRGYVVAIVDNTSKSGDAIYWKDEFLKVAPRNDDFFQTKQLIKLCKEFVTEKLPLEFEAGKADQAELLNHSLEYFKSNEQFDINDFKKEVIKQPELIEAFDEFKGSYEEANELKLQNSFFIEDDAVKKQTKMMKSIIKLDKNFHIYIHGGRERISKGFDEKTGLNYYQIYFQEEK
jgi:hypothetical protein